MVMMLSGEIKMFADVPSSLFMCLFIATTSIISFGFKGLVESVKGWRYLFTAPNDMGQVNQNLSVIYANQIKFAYAGALLLSIVGAIATHANIVKMAEGFGLHLSYAVILLGPLYAVIFSEVLLRPLIVKMQYAK
jgi:hypothetical protein